MALGVSVSSILGARLPTVGNWLHVKWVAGLFGLFDNGITYLEFQSRAREAAGVTPSALKRKSPVTPRMEVIGFGAYGVSKLLGTSPPTRENWLDDHWLQALFGLSARGVRFGAFRSWGEDVAFGNSNRGLVESLPSLLLDEEALKSKTSELALYVKGLDRTRFYEREYLKEIKENLEMHRLLYWNRLDVKIPIQARLGLAPGLADVNGVPQRIRDLYNTVPFVHDTLCHVVKEGSNCKPWVMQCGFSTGEHGIKKAARMIAIIRRHIDPSFDPEDYGPPSPVSGKRKRQGIFEF